MSRLEDVEKDLYGQNDAKLNKRMRRSFVLPEMRDAPPNSWESQPQSDVPEPFMSKRMLKIFVTSLAVVVLVTTGAFLYFYLTNKGQEAAITIQGRDRIDSGEIVSIPFSFKNISRSALQNVNFTIIFPDGTHIIEDGVEKAAPPRLIKKFDDLAPGQEQSFEVSARLFGKENEEKKVDTTLSYQPEGLRANFSTNSSKIFTIGHVPLAISWESPDTVSPNQDVQIRVHYISSSQLTFNNLSLKLDYPPGFSFGSADPKPDVGNTIWKIGDMSPNREGFITIKGTLGGDAGSVKDFKSTLGVFDDQTQAFSVYSESTQELKIATNPLSVQISVDGTREKLISAGDNLNITLHYKNNSAEALKNITIHTFLEGGSGESGDQIFAPDSGNNLIELNSLSINSGGVYDHSSKSIIWSSGNLPDLQEIQPGGEGDIIFSIHVLDNFPVLSSKDKSLILRIRASIDAGDIPQDLAGTKVGSEDKLDLKTRSKLAFSAKSSHKSSLITNTGSLPPRIGKKTTYTIYWETRNYTNDLQNMQVKATLPPNVKWENSLYPTGVNIVFDDSSREVRWLIGKLPAGTGILSPTLVGAFQVSVTPSDLDLGKVMSLANKSILSGLDVFTGENINVEADALTTELKEDSSSSPSDWIVIK